MTDSSSKTVEILGVLAAAYPNFDLKVQTIKIYCEMLDDLDPELLEQAAKAHMVTNKYFPSVAEIRENVGKLIERATNTPSPTEAWGEVVEKIRIFGHTFYGGKVPDFSSPIITKVVSYFGWNDLCLSENPIADRARFLQAYEVELDRAREDIRFLPETHNVVEKLKAGNANEGIRKLTMRLSLPGKMLPQGKER